MSDKKEDLRITRTRHKLCESLLEMMETESIEKVSVIELCEKADINRATFYAHFEDKFHLLNVALEELKDKLYTRFTQDITLSSPTETISTISSIAISFFFEEQNAIANIINHNRNSKVVNTVEDSLAKSIRYELYKYKDDYNVKVPLTLLSHYLSGGLTKAIMLLLDNPGKYTKDDFTRFTLCKIGDTFFEKKKQSQ